MFDRFDDESLLHEKAGSVSRNVDPGAYMVYKWRSYFDAWTLAWVVQKFTPDGCEAEQLTAKIQNIVQVCGQVVKPGTGCWSCLPCAWVNFWVGDQWSRDPLSHVVFCHCSKSDHF